MERSVPTPTILAALLAGALAVPPAVTAQRANAGFMYGRVVTDSGSEYRGFLRWGTQEAFWDDLFNSVKRDLPAYDYLDREQADRLREPGTRVRVLDREMRVQRPSSRQFVTRFGDIARVEVGRRGRAWIVMRNGSEHEVAGGSDDVSDAVHVEDPSFGEIDLRWDRIRSVDFAAAPRDAEPSARRLRGTVETLEGIFEGFIQWDMDECLTTDVLDGDTEDGDVSIRMGAIASIERLSRRGALVTLGDGREMRLEGSNDVNDQNRGVMIEDERFGRVTVAWRAFERVTFTEARGSGRGLSDYPPLGELAGTVIDVEGGRHAGRIVFDLDEAEGWEMLNGDVGDVSFDIPFARVAALERVRGGATRVVLTNGETLTLAGTHDVGPDNSGVLVFADRDPTYLPWRAVERIELGG